MTPLTPLPRGSHTAFLQRAALMAKPPEFFSHAFGGRNPSFVEKATWIEERVLEMSSFQTFANDLYIVAVEPGEPFSRLSIQRHDRQPCRDWKHLQQMKNELFGPGHEAVELFPAEDRLIDTANEYHLWVHADPHYRFPLGFRNGRYVDDEKSACTTDRCVAAA